MLIILPLLTFVILLLDFAGLHSRRRDGLADLRAIFLQAAVFIAGYLLIFSEILSLFKLLTQPWAAVSWGFGLGLTTWLGWKKGLIADGWRYLQAKWQRPDRFDLAAGIMLAIILILLFVIAVIVPPNNNDSLLYHMSRVMHWAQDRSLAHYPTGYQNQLYLPIFSELAILNARLLIGSDRLANLIQWSCLLGVVLGVSALAGLLGAGKRGQWAAAAFAVSIPMAILQSTSTQNDLVTAFWLICLLYFVMLSRQRRLAMHETFALALALGLGLCTKSTFYAYAVVPTVYFAFLAFKKMGFRAALFTLIMVGAIAAVLNLGYWLRNVGTYGTPLGPKEFVASHAEIQPKIGTLLGSFARNVMQNFATPSEKVNTGITDQLKSIFKKIDPTMEKYSLTWGWNQEDLAGEPLHLLLVPITVALLIIFRRKIQSIGIPYTVVALGLFLALAAIVSYETFGVRFQLPFFVAWSPLFGVLVEVLGRKWLTSTVVMLLLVATLPWVFFNRTRPLIAMRASTDPFTIPCLAGCTTGSILNEPPSSILFGAWVDLRKPYISATDVIKASGCREVGLQLDSHDFEYPFWWLLNAPQSGIRLETIYTVPALERYIDPSFKPCAILCTICRNKNHLHGLDMVGDFSGKVRLFMGANYDPDPSQ